MSTFLRHDLEWLLRPCTVDDFVSTTWQQRIRLIRNDEDRVVADLFDSLQLEQLIDVAQPRPPSIRLAAHGRDAVAVPQRSDGRLDLDLIRAHFLDGYTIIVNNVQHYHPALHEFVQTMQQETSFLVEANCYFTPPGAQGFQPHYDTHDVFVLHVEGSKLWSVYGDEAACPLHELVDGDPFRDDELPEPTEITLHPGDVLYIPRGWVHEAISLPTSVSLHLTFGVHAPTGRDLLRAAIEVACRTHPEFRTALPFGYLATGANRPDLEPTLSRLLALLEEHSPVEAATGVLEDDLTRRFATTGAVGLAALSTSLDGLGMDDVVERVRHLHVRVIAGDDEIALQFLHRLVRLPKRYDLAVDAVLASTSPFVVSDLPGLGADEQLALTETLLRDGLLRLAPVRHQPADASLTQQPTALKSAAIAARSRSITATRRSTSVRCRP